MALTLKETGGYTIDCNYIVRVKDLMPTYSYEYLPLITITTEMMEDVCCR